MANVDPKKLGALVDKHAQKKAPPKKPGGGFPPKQPNEHAKEEAEHEGHGETPEHEQGEHDEGKDHQIAEQQAARVENGNGEDALHDLVEGMEHEHGDEPPEWALDHDIWERAEKAVAALDDVSEENHAAVLAHTYQALGGEIEGHDAGKGHDHDGSDDEEPEHKHDDAGEDHEE